MMITPLNNNVNYKNNYRLNQQNFMAKAPIEECEELIKATKESSFFKPLSDSYDKFTDKIADKVTSKFVDSKFIDYLSDKFKNSKNLFQHCLTVGSMVTSGLYVQRTLANKDLDKDRRNTLAVNQTLTFGVSTIGAYVLDKYLKGWWDNITARFAGHLLNDKDFYEDFIKQKKEAIEHNTAVKKAGKNAKEEMKSMPSVEKLVKKHHFYKNATENDAKAILNKVKGMGLLRTMIVFGFVYRYFVPVAVTKPANKLCEKYLQHKKEHSDK